MNVLPRDIASAVSDAEVLKLAELARDKVVLEMGSHYGFSTIVLAQLAKELHAVDWHQGDDQAGRNYSLPAYSMNLQRYAMTDKVITHVGKFEDVLPLFPPDYFDTVFLDGAHDLKSVARDMLLAERVCKPGGRIAFHDFGRFEVAPVVQNYALETDQAIDLADSLAVVTKPELHVREPRFHELRDRLSLRGIIHIGINIGQEIPWYAMYGYGPLLVFEPHPSAFAELARKYGAAATCVELALGAETRTLDLLLPDDGDTERASKFHPIETPGHDWTRVKNSTSIPVEQVRLDAWVRQTHIDLSPYNVVVLDVQGMELEALRGFGPLLSRFDVFEVECSEKPVYDGEAPADEVIDWMASRGFHSATEVREHDDIVFVREGLL